MFDKGVSFSLRELHDELEKVLDKFRSKGSNLENIVQGHEERIAKLESLVPLKDGSEVYKKK